MAQALAVRVRFPAWSASVRSRPLVHLITPWFNAREHRGFSQGDVGSIPIGSANFDGPLSLGYR